MVKQMGIYRPRSPQKSPFYQCIADHFEEFVQVYDERFEREYGLVIILDILLLVKASFRAFKKGP
jgi:hypothetical protein